MPPGLTEILKEKFKQKFPTCEFKLTGNNFAIINVQLPIIPEEINRIIKEATQSFNMRVSQIGWVQENSSITILYNP